LRSVNLAQNTILTRVVPCETSTDRDVGEELTRTYLQRVSEGTTRVGMVFPKTKKELKKLKN